MNNRDMLKQHRCYRISWGRYFCYIDADTLGGVRIRCESNNKLEDKDRLRVELSKSTFLIRGILNIDIEAK